MNIKMVCGGNEGGGEFKKVAVGEEDLVGASAFSTQWIYNQASITPTVGTYYTNKYDVSAVNSVKLSYYFNAGSFSYVNIGYEIDGTFTRLEPTTTATTVTINLSSASKLSFCGNVWSSTTEGARIMGGYVKFS